MLNEIDIVDLVTSLRISSFVNQMKLTNHQRYFINKFDMYSIHESQDINEKSIKRKSHEQKMIQSGLDENTLEYKYKMVEKLDEENKVDRRIIYEITGIELWKEKYD